MTPTANHPFTLRPHRTLFALSLPLLISLIAEPVTGLIDTAFVASLGAVPLAALGVGTVVLSSTFWVFNFLGIGTQTSVAQALGKGEAARAGQIASLALLLSGAAALLLILLIYPTAAPLAAAMGAEGAIQADAVAYMRIRLFGAPAVLATMVAFAAQRGLQDMRSPLFIAVGVNVLNIFLDYLLIFGAGPFPAMGVAGAALASTAAQWLGALAAVLLVGRQLGLSAGFKLADARALIKIGGDLFMRTGLLMLFLILATRVATQAGAESGAAHQAIRQIYVFTALFLEAFALSAQSLVGYFFGAADPVQAKRVVAVSTVWSLATGVLLGLLMWLLTDSVIALLVPASAAAVFIPAWLISAASQPLNALAFITDGVHWGTGDYRYLRNGMLAATVSGAAVLFLINPASRSALNWVWVATAVWITVRAAFGLLRVWPAVGRSPFKT